MKINYNDLKTLIDDFRYIVQTGGNPFTVQDGSGIMSSSKSVFFMVLEVMKTIVFLLVYIVLIYFLYIILFKGYPRFIMDILSFGFYKKQNLDKLFSENKFFENHFKFLMKRSNEFIGLDPHVSFSALVKTNKLKDIIEDVETNMNEYYKNYKYTRRYVETFREYFLYYNKLNKEFNNTTGLDTCGDDGMMESYQQFQELEKKKNDNEISKLCQKKKCVRIHKELLRNPNYLPPQCKASLIETSLIVDVNQRTQPEKVNCPAPMFVIEYPEFYDTLLEYLKKTGQYKVKGKAKEIKKERDFQLAELYYLDLIGVNTHIKRVRLMNCAIKKLARELKEMVNSLNETQFSLFLIIPEITDNDTKRKFSSNLMTHFGDIQLSPSPIYSNNVRYDSLNDYTWYLFEVIHNVFQYPNNYSKSYKDLEGAIRQMMAGSPYELTLFLTSYINLDFQKKLKAESTILLNYENIPYNKKLVDLLEWVNKHPVFSHIYFNSVLTTSKKPELYNKVISAYEYLLYTKRIKEDTPTSLSNEFDSSSSFPKTNGNIGFQLIENLINNARHFKEYINAINILNLYLNTYQEQLSILYAEQYRSNVKFFKEMWNPYFNEIFNNRVLQYYRRMVQSRNTAKSFSRFIKLWKMVGRMVKRLKTEISAAFKRGMVMPEEQPPPQG